MPGNSLAPARWATLSRQLDALLACEPAERERQLGVLSGEDIPLADELRGLLRLRDDASRAGFLSDAASPAFLSAVAQAGDEVGAWTLVDSIGEGGMGSVWRARRSDGRFEGEAAIKLLRSGLFDASAQARFRREGAILAKLRQPGIAQLLDAGVTPRGQPYLVLELVRGEQIDHWCDAHALDVRRRIELFLQVLDAVAAAHVQLVIHRDLKPSNILVDEGGRVRLLDFGIAHLLPGPSDGELTALTCENGLALTPRYAAPEQFKNGELSMSTDVYALGVVLYELLTGAHPSGLPSGSPALTHMQAALDGRSIAASSAAPARRRELRGDVDTILTKACAVEPLARYPSALSLREDLQRHLDDLPIVARPATFGYRLAKLVRRRPLESALAAAVILAVPAGAHVQVAVLASFGIGTGVALWQMRSARRQTERARAEQQRAEAITRFIASTFSQAVPREGAGGVVTAADLLDSARERVQGELHGEPQVAAELLTIVAYSFLELGDVAAAKGILPNAVDRCELAFGSTHPITLHARTGLAKARVVQGELDAAERMLPALLADLRGKMPDSATDLVAALRHSSYVLTKRGDTSTALATLHEALAIACEHLGPASRPALETMGLLGNTLATFGRDAEAIAALEPAVATARELYGSKRPNIELARLESFLASSMIAVGRYREAEDLLRQVFADQWALDGCDTTRNCFTRNMLAVVRAYRGAFDEGIVLMQQVIVADRQLNAVPTIDTGTMTAQFGEMLVEAGRFEEGLAALERAEAIVGAAGGAGQEFPSMRRRIRRAHALLVAGQAGAALAEATSIVDRSGDAGSWIQAAALRVRVAALRNLSRLDEAEADLARMLESSRATHVSPLNTARAYMEAAALRRDQGRVAEGAELARHAVGLLVSTQVPESRLLRQASELAGTLETQNGDC